jgi:hypothetical protein
MKITSKKKLAPEHDKALEIYRITSRLGESGAKSRTPAGQNSGKLEGGAGRVPWARRNEK